MDPPSPQTKKCLETLQKKFGQKKNIYIYIYGIGATIQIGREIHYLPYAGFFCLATRNTTVDEFASSVAGQTSGLNACQSYHLARKPGIIGSPQLSSPPLC